MKKPKPRVSSRARHLNALREFDRVRWWHEVRAALFIHLNVVDAASALGVGKRTLQGWIARNRSLARGIKMRPTGRPRRDGKPVRMEIESMSKNNRSQRERAIKSHPLGALLLKSSTAGDAVANRVLTMWIEGGLTEASAAVLAVQSYSEALAKVRDAHEQTFAALHGPPGRVPPLVVRDPGMRGPNGEQGAVR